MDGSNIGTVLKEDSSNKETVLKEDGSNKETVLKEDGSSRGRIMHAICITRREDRCPGHAPFNLPNHQLKEGTSYF